MLAKLAFEVIPQDPARPEYRQGHTLGEDEDTKRAYESSDDAYRVFRKMLEGGHPPDDWDQLLVGSRAASTRLKPAILNGISQ